MIHALIVGGIIVAIALGYKTNLNTGLFGIVLAYILLMMQVMFHLKLSACGPPPSSLCTSACLCSLAWPAQTEP